jgi:uncharacterized repeat protein (TIGR01451 family)
MQVAWNWDELGTAGNNSMDACGLFDTDGDTNVNYSICITTSDSPATLSTVTIYSCGDAKVDRCTSQVDDLPGPYATTCTVNQQSTDPFPAGAASPTDTVASCTFVLSDIGQTSAVMTDVCSYPSKEPNSDPSDCVIIQDDPVALIEVIKDVVPNDPVPKFNLTVDGPANNDTSTVNDVSDGGSTGIIGLNPGNNGGIATVSESAGTNTTLANYSASINCVKRGTATVVASGNGTSLQVPVNDTDNIVCTIMNTRQTGNIKVVKDVVNDNGGTKTYADFSFTLDGTNYSFNPTTSPDGERTVTLPTGGTYSVVEPEANTMGYATSYSNCTDLTVVAGQTQTCTITNDDVAPQLTVIKHVITDNGGTHVASDFTMNVTGTNVSDSSFAGSEAPGTTVTLNAGKYSVGESGPDGYEASYSADCTGDITLGDTKTCTITNNDITATLQLIKTLIKDNSGTASATDWILTAQEEGEDPIIDEAGTTNDGGVTAETSTVDASAGIVYVLSESGPEGYTPGEWSCDGGILDGNNLTLQLAQNVICTIINDDVAQPAINIVKSGPATAHEGDTVTYTFDVTNTGDTATLAGVTVTDTVDAEVSNAVYVSGDTNNDGLLQKTETWHFTINYPIPEDTELVINIGEACGFDPAQTKVCDTDTHTLDVLHPEILVEKTASTEEANPGDTVTYTFTVTNIGDTPLSITKVEDKVGVVATQQGVYQSGDINENDLLDLSEVWIYTADYTIPADQDELVINTVEVCGQDVLEGEDCDTDTHTLVVLAEVIVTKYNDYNRNGVQNEGEPVVPDWEFTLSCDNPEFEDFLILAIDEVQALPCQDKTQSTGQDGTTTFADVRPDAIYRLSETIPEGSNWHFSGAECTGGEYSQQDEVVAVFAAQGATVNCKVGNYRDASLLLSKANDTPTPVNTGATVTYTLTVTVPDDSGAVFDAQVTDLPPEGFVYQTGTWTANSSVRGDIKNIVTTEPTYGSPGVWLLDKLLPGEVVTLTYQALISGTVSDGTYPDLAFAAGCDVPIDGEITACPEGGALFANVTNEDGSPFVGTNVSVVSPAVLAANITRYVNTGANDVWFNTIAAITLAGATLITLVRREQKGAK